MVGKAEMNKVKKCGREEKIQVSLLLKFSEFSGSVFVVVVVLGVKSEVVVLVLISIITVHVKWKISDSTTFPN